MVDGAVRIQLQSNWTDKHGIHKKRVSFESIDGFAVYCPDTSAVYYVNAKEVAGLKNLFALRVTESKNSQRAKVRLASDYTSPHRLF